MAIEQRAVQIPLQFHFEKALYRLKGELPDHFKEARRLYGEKLLPDDAWYEEHKGKFIAIIGNEILVDEDDDSLMRNAYQKWGYRPIFMSQVTREKKRVIIRPRARKRQIPKS